MLDDVRADAQVEAWLVAHGWTQAELTANGWAVWSRGEHCVQVPLKTKAPDWHRALALALSEICRVMADTTPAGEPAWAHPPGALARGMVGLPVLVAAPLDPAEVSALADKLRAALRAGGAGPIVPVPTERRKLESLASTVCHLCWLVVEHAGCSEPEDLEAVADVEDALRALGLQATDYGVRR